MRIRNPIRAVLAAGILAGAAPAAFAAALSAAAEFKTVAAAQAHCPGGAVVWSTLAKSHVYHLSSSRYFGKTKHGAYVCQSDANAAGFHAAKS
jgi:hypothetical protein